MWATSSTSKNSNLSVKLHIETFPAIIVTVYLTEETKRAVSGHQLNLIVFNPLYGDIINLYYNGIKNFGLLIIAYLIDITEHTVARELVIIACAIDIIERTVAPELVIITCSIDITERILSV